MKKEKDDDKPNKVDEPEIVYGKKSLRIYNSFEEQREDELKYMASLTPTERLMEMRKLINLAYGLHGFDPANLPEKHTIKIVSYKGKVL